MFKLDLIISMIESVYQILVVCRVGIHGGKKKKKKPEKENLLLSNPKSWLFIKKRLLKISFSLNGFNFKTRN